MTLLDGFDEYQLVVQDWVDQLGAAGNADRRRAMDEARRRLVDALAAADRDAAIVAAAREWRRAYDSVDDGDGRWGRDTRLALAAAIDAAAVGADAPATDAHALAPGPSGASGAGEE